MDTTFRISALTLRAHKEGTYVQQQHPNGHVEIIQLWEEDPEWLDNEMLFVIPTRISSRAA